MDITHKIFETRGPHWTTLSKEEFTAMSRELHEAGWRRNTDRPEPDPMRAGRQCFPWWTDPVTNEDVRGFRRAMQIAVARAVPPPSERAVRVMEALSRHPELAEDVRRLLNKACRVHAPYQKQG